MPFEVPDNWEWVKISDIAISIQYGYTGKAISNGKYKMLRITDIQNNYVDWSSVPFVEIDDDKADNYLLYDGDILFARTGATVGKSFLIKNLMDKSVFASYLIRINSSKKIHAEYIKFFFESNYYWEQIIKKSLGTGQPNVNGTILGSLAIPLPPLSEQKRLVSKLEQLFELIDFIEQNKLSLNQLIAQTKNNVLELAIRGKLVPHNPNDEPASLLLDRISKTKNSKITTDKSHYNKLPKGWINVQLEDVFKITMGQSPKGTSISNNSTGTEFHQGKTFFTDKYLAGSNLYTSSPTKVIQGPCVLLCVRAPVGVVNISNNTICIGRGLCAITPMKNVSVDFVYYWIKTLEQSFVEKSTGSTFQSISMNTVKKSVISFPPLAEQQRIVSQIERIFAQLDIIEDSLKA